MLAQNKVGIHTVVGTFMTSCSLVDGHQKRLKNKSVSSAEIFEIIHQITRHLKSGHIEQTLGLPWKIQVSYKLVIIFVNLFTKIIRMEVHGIYRDCGSALEHKVWNVAIKDLRRKLAEIRVFSGKLIQLWTDDCNISSLLPP